MVIGGETPAAAQQTIPPANIDNIMSGIGNTGTVKMNNHRKKLRQRFDIIKKLGQGTYGKVQLGINKETGQEVAIKTIKKCKIETEADLIRIRREVQIMSSVQHPNIIHIYEVFENREKMVLVMEFAAGGELYDYLSERKVLSESEARRVFRQIATAVYYCHKHKICHRDLKLENILLDEHGSAKIADFGLSNVFDDQRLLATFCGSPLYASPEIVKGTPYQGPEVDCWSLGVLLYTLVYGAMPFDGSNFKRLVKQISQGDYYEPKKASPASALIREMLTVCPKRRATIEQICNHWWVNESYQESCLNLAEELANQTPVRLDVLLSLSPPSVTSEQLVVPTSGDESKTHERVPRSHSVGSVIDLANTDAERRILDMVAAGGEAALMPSPTRTITPAESPAQTKRKLEQTASTENAIGALKKKDKPIDKSTSFIISDNINVDSNPIHKEQSEVKDTEEESIKDLSIVENKCDEIINNTVSIQSPEKKKVIKKKVQSPQDINADIKPVKKLIVKTKTNTIIEESMKDDKPLPSNVKVSQGDESVGRRKSRVFEVAEKFQTGNNQISEKPMKFGPSGLVGNFKKEFERKASLPTLMMDKPVVDIKTKRDEKLLNQISDDIAPFDSKASITNFSLEEARKSMENSIALLNKAKTESSKEVDQLIARADNFAVSENCDREKKLKSAREIIGNAIQPGRLCLSGVRKPPVPFGINGRSISGSVIPSTTNNPADFKLRLQTGAELTDTRMSNTPVSTPEQITTEPSFGNINDNTNVDVTKTSRAEITLKSATLPRRKPTKSEVHLDLQPKTERGMRFSTEMQHQIPDLRSAPIREHPAPYSPLSIDQRAISLEPQAKEHIIAIQRPPTYSKLANSISYRSGSLSRQSTNDSDTDTATLNNSLSQTSTIGSNSQPIKKSPREFIIPIAVEGGGYVTPRAGSLEPSDSSNTANTSFSKFSRPRRSLLTDTEDESPFQRIHRHTSTIGRESDNEEPRFNTMHRLRSSRPMKSRLQDPNDSASSGEDDDEDGFEILTAENLFSTLLSRVRALTNRLNVNDTHSFPSSRIMNNLRQAHTPFWNHDPFGSNLNKSSSPWRHTMSRDLGSEIDSMFSRSGATLPRVGLRVSLSHAQNSRSPQSAKNNMDNE